MFCHARFGEVQITLFDLGFWDKWLEWLEHGTSLSGLISFEHILKQLCSEKLAFGNPTRGGFSKTMLNYQRVFFFFTKRNIDSVIHDSNPYQPSSNPKKQW